MRLYPTASGGTLRALKKDTRLGPYTLPAGFAVSMHFYSMHRNPNYWDHPTDFLPVGLVPCSLHNPSWFRVMSYHP